MTAGDRGAESLIFKTKTIVPAPQQLISAAEPEHESSVVLKKLLGLASGSKKRKDFGPAPPQLLPNLLSPLFH